LRTVFSNGKSHIACDNLRFVTRRIAEGAYLNVGVIIVNYNAGPALSHAAQSSIACARVSQVVVVDNASRDGSMAALQAACGTSDKLRVVLNEVNRGFAVACNQALATLDQAYLLYLNPDCVLTPAALETLLAALVADPRAAMAGPVLRYPDGRVQAGGRRAAPTPWRSFVRASGLYRLSRYFPRLLPDLVLPQEALGDAASEVDAISGACMLVRREAMQCVGALDEGYFLHCEDLDWCMRFRLAGWKVLFVPRATVTHEKGVCSVSRPVFVAWHKHRGMVRFYRKFYADQQAWPLRLAVLLGVWAHFAVKLPVAIYRAGRA
jgi:GT2 family glycosyltransferase